MGTLLAILQWAIPSGGIGAAIAWLANRKVQRVKATKEVHDTFHSMYDDVSKLLEETQKKYEKTSKQLEELTTENARTRRSLNRLSRAIEAIQICPYKEKCPVRSELSLDGNDDGKLQDDKKCDGKADDNAAGHCDGGKSDDGDCANGHGTTGDSSCGPDEPAD